MASFIGEKKSVREPLFHIVKKNSVTTKQAILIRTLGVLSGFVFSALLCLIMVGANPVEFVIQLFSGAFGMEYRIWDLLKETALLLGVGLALIPAFKMKFWNLGGNGQILMGALAASACMITMGKSGVSDGLIILTMIPASILAGAIWAVIPAIFKAFFNTNETLFTLMMNYIAVGIVAICISIWDVTGSQTIGIIQSGNLPRLGNDSLLTILVVAILTALIFVYLKFSKHGYELSVVGESENTARYIGLNVKKVIIRTMVLSGAICGIIGLLLAGAINHTISDTTAKNLGFTAIIVAWLAKFNPLMMILTSFFVAFLTKGMGQVQTYFGISSNAVCDLIIAIMYFFVIGCEFFISYKIITKKKSKKEGSGDSGADKKEGEEKEKFSVRFKKFINKVFSLKKEKENKESINSVPDNDGGNE